MPILREIFGHGFFIESMDMAINKLRGPISIVGNGAYGYTEGKGGHGYTEGKGDMAILMERRDMSILN